MEEWEFLKHVRNLKCESNKFKDNGFFVKVIELFYKDRPIQRVAETVIICGDRDIWINGNNFITVAFITTIIISNNFAFDPWVKLKIKEEVFDFNGVLLYDEDDILRFNNIYDTLVKENCYEVKIMYSDEEHANRINVYKKAVWYVIDRYHDDDFYLNKALDELDKKKNKF